MNVTVYNYVFRYNVSGRPAITKAIRRKSNEIRRIEKF